MTSDTRPLDPPAFERLYEQLTVAMVRCTDEQVLELADSLHALLRRRRGLAASPRRIDETRSWVD